MLEFARENVGDSEKRSIVVATLYVTEEFRGVHSCRGKREFSRSWRIVELPDISLETGGAEGEGGHERAGVARERIPNSIVTLPGMNGTGRVKNSSRLLHLLPRPERHNRTPVQPRACLLSPSSRPGRREMKLFNRVPSVRPAHPLSPPPPTTTLSTARSDIPSFPLWPASLLRASHQNGNFARSPRKNKQNIEPRKNTRDRAPLRIPR